MVVFTRLTPYTLCAIVDNFRGFGRPDTGHVSACFYNVSPMNPAPFYHFLLLKTLVSAPDGPGLSGNRIDQKWRNFQIFTL